MIKKYIKLFLCFISGLSFFNIFRRYYQKKYSSGSLNYSPYQISSSRILQFLTFPLKEAIIEFGNEIKMIIFPNDYIGRILFFSQNFDQRITWACDKFISPGDTVLDIGANQGWITLYASGIVGATGRIVSIEPQPELAQLISRSISLNKLHQVTLFNIALSNADGSFPLFVNGKNKGMASLEKSAQLDRKIDVDLRETNKFLSSLQLESIALMKIDVEGHEATIIRSGFEYFMKHPPKVIVFESLWSTIPFWDRELIGLLSDLGYLFYRFVLTNNQIGLERIPLNDQTLKGDDYIAIHDPKMLERIYPERDIGS